MQYGNASHCNNDKKSSDNCIANSLLSCSGFTTTLNHRICRQVAIG